MQAPPLTNAQKWENPAYIEEKNKFNIAEPAMLLSYYLIRDYD